MTKENLKGKSTVVKNLRRKSVFRYALIGQGIIIGVTTGLIIALFFLGLILFQLFRPYQDAKTLRTGKTMSRAGT